MQCTIIFLIVAIKENLVLFQVCNSQVCCSACRSVRCLETNIYSDRIATEENVMKVKSYELFHHVKVGN